MEDTGRAFSGVDNLIRLPDELLSRILSLLCIEDAVRTSVLSKRWRYLFTSISNLDLDFSYDVEWNAHKQDFMNFVDRLLFYRKKCAIDKFKLTWKMSQALDPIRLKNWIEVVLGRGIRELDLCIYDFERIDLLLPSSLFTSKTLEVLKLHIYTFDDSGTGFETGEYGLKLPTNVCLPSLKSIDLYDVSFSEDSWSRLFPNCPILEDLIYDIGHCDYNLYVSSPTLKRLTVCWACGSPDVVVVDAPSLLYLELYINELGSLKFGNAESIVEADIGQFYYALEIPSVISNARELMRGIRNIKALCITKNTLIITSTFLLQNLKHCSVPIPVLHNLTHLTIIGFGEGLNSLPYLLEKCECLETLVLHDLFEHDPGIWNNVEESRIRCLTSVVKTIKVCEFMGKKSELEMVNYFLKVARVLERMEIHLGSQCENPSKIANELHMLPKISEALMDVRF